MRYDITLLTDHRWVAPVNPDGYAQNILTEDRFIREALERQGLRVSRTNWDNPDFDWTDTKYALFRSTWDYFDRFEEFKQWLEVTSTKTLFINEINLIKWNMDKHYFSDLKAKGINIPETFFIEPGDDRSLQEAIADTGWERVVLKPAVSGSGRHTYLLNADNIKAHEGIFRDLIDKESMLLQLYQEQITTKGEVALMMMGGQFTHAVLKKAKVGDFRVQDDFGGTVHDYTPDDELIAFGQAVIAACPSPPLYARVDVIWNNRDELTLSELEIIEPELWFRNHPKSAETLAEKIMNAYF